MTESRPRGAPSGGESTAQILNEGPRRTAPRVGEDGPRARAEGGGGGRDKPSPGCQAGERAPVKSGQVSGRVGAATGSRRPPRRGVPEARCSLRAGLTGPRLPYDRVRLICWAGEGAEPHSFRHVPVRSRLRLPATSRWSTTSPGLEPLASDGNTKSWWTVQLRMVKAGGPADRGDVWSAGLWGRRLGRAQSLPERAWVRWSGTGGAGGQRQPPGLRRGRGGAGVRAARRPPTPLCLNWDWDSRGPWRGGASCPGTDA